MEGLSSSLYQVPFLKAKTKKKKRQKLKKKNKLLSGLVVQADTLQLLEAELGGSTPVDANGFYKRKNRLFSFLKPE